MPFGSLPNTHLLRNGLEYRPFFALFNGPVQVRRLNSSYKRALPGLHGYGMSAAGVPDGSGNESRETYSPDYLASFIDVL